VSSHDFDARLFPAILLVEQVVGLQVQHARGLPVIHEPTLPLLAVIRQIVTNNVVLHHVAAGLVADHLVLVGRVVPVGLWHSHRLAGGRLPAPVHDGAVRRPHQYHALRVVRLVHQPLGVSRPASAQRLRPATTAANGLRASHVRQPVRDAVVR